MSARPVPAIALTSEAPVTAGQPAQEISWPQIIVAAHRWPPPWPVTSTSSLCPPGPPRSSPST